MERPGFLRLVRADDWWLYHLLPLLAAAYAAIAYYAVPPGLALPALLRLLLSIVCIAAYSHVVNDIADADQDAEAGKSNRWRTVPPWQKAALSLTLLLCGFAVWVGADLSVRSLVLLAGIAGLQPLYALHPVRLKERGAWGLIADALHTHALPTLYCIALFADLAGASVWRPFPLAATAWAFFVGMRGILYHQRTDEANDRRAGVRTFVTTHGSDRAAVIARRLVLPTELVSLGLLGVTLFPVAPVVVAALVVYGGLIQLLRWAGIEQGSLADPAPAERGAYVPLLAFYRSWPGVAFALLLAWRDPAFLVVLLLHAVVFAPLLLREAGDLWDLLWWYGRAPFLVARRVARGRG
ncbi:MAG TPA: UbiA family prenyltransferase [Longimicrobiaceae bacterium]|nr:UbiA family prenyltransferase [Longimicrobiaceae bacterium]